MLFENLYLSVVSDYVVVIRYTKAIRYNTGIKPEVIDRHVYVTSGFFFALSAMTESKELLPIIVIK